MTLPRKELLKSCSNPTEIEALIDQADLLIKTWQSSWSGFVTAPIREEIINLMSPLDDLYWECDGGYPTAERQRMQCLRNSTQNVSLYTSAPISGVLIEGNFLFDKAKSIDFRESLLTMGVDTKQLGDIWTIKDRGAQLICTPEAALELNGKYGMVRDIEIHYTATELTQLQLPVQRTAKQFYTIEASTRIDAIASAGFGLSRAKIIKKIQLGLLRLNWQPIRQGSKALNPGDQLNLEGKGSLKVLSIATTKRQRWRIELLRQ